jgi:hypothetical protein
MDLWLETAEKEGREIPSPRAKALLAKLHESAARKKAGEAVPLPCSAEAMIRSCGASNSGTKPPFGQREAGWSG